MSICFEYQSLCSFFFQYWFSIHCSSFPPFCLLGHVCLTLAWTMLLWFNSCIWLLRDLLSWINCSSDVSYLFTELRHDESVFFLFLWLDKIVMCTLVSLWNIGFAYISFGALHLFTDSCCINFIRVLDSALPCNLLSYSCCFLRLWSLKLLCHKFSSAISILYCSFCVVSFYYQIFHCTGQAYSGCLLLCFVSLFPFCFFQFF